MNQGSIVFNELSPEDLIVPTPKEIFIMAVEKLIKLNRFKRKKFNLFDIIKSLKENASNN